jgi:hypothetical protein
MVSATTFAELNSRSHLVTIFSYANASAQ